jgi:hypothetical protein
VRIDATPTGASYVDESDVERFECRLDDGDFVPCTTPWRYDDLSKGEHTFQVRAHNDAGQTGAAAHFVWTVFNLAPVAVTAVIVKDGVLMWNRRIHSRSCGYQPQLFGFETISAAVSRPKSLQSPREKADWQSFKTWCIF